MSRIAGPEDLPLISWQLAQPLFANKALAVVTSAGFISARAMVVAAVRTRVRIRGCLEVVIMASAFVG